MKKGFTLAEVLITLGIIGVVAAITIPALIENYRGIHFKTQYKKEVSMLGQMVKMSIAQGDDDVSGGPNLNIFKKYAKGQFMCKGAHCETVEHWGTGSTPPGAYYDKEGTALTNGVFGSEFEDYYYYFSFLDGSGVVLPVGAGMDKMDYADGYYNETGLPYCTATNYKTNWCSVVIDVNGKKGPNKASVCSNGTKGTNTAIIQKNRRTENCIVKNSDIGDMFEVYIYDDKVEPATNADKYVLTN